MLETSWERDFMLADSKVYSCDKGEEPSRCMDIHNDMSDIKRNMLKDELRLYSLGHQAGRTPMKLSSFMLLLIYSGVICTRNTICALCFRLCSHTRV